jgi:hypothetical protein
MEDELLFGIVHEPAKTLNDDFNCCVPPPHDDDDDDNRYIMGRSVLVNLNDILS